MCLNSYDFIPNVTFAVGRMIAGGQLSHFARFENCIFTRNSAEEFGAAMSVSTILFLRYTGGITPVEIVDW